MTGYQFGHWDTFSRKGNSRNRTAAQVCAEAERLAGSCPHVPNPAPPNLLRGVMPMEALAIHDACLAAPAGKKLRGKGRGIRQDTHSLSGIVLSYPVPIAELSEEKKRADYKAWREDAARWLETECERHAMRFLSLVEHLDESHPHLHCLAIAENERRDVKRCHPGYAAMMTAPKGQEARVFREAMRQWQDRLHEELCAPHGMTRLGPGRRRLSRAQWQAEKAAAQALKAEREVVDQKHERITAERKRLDAAQAEIEQQKLALRRAQRLAEQREAEALAAQQAAEASEKPMQAIVAAIDAWVAGEIVDALSSPENGDELVYAEDLPVERKRNLIDAIAPGFEAAFKVLFRLVEIAKRLPEAALAQLRGDVATAKKGLRLK
jgi:hypothetical protein